MFTYFALLLGSFALGALHALEPGHGKTLVAAYLVGSRGRWYHAVYLGAVTTLTHTAGIIGLGLLAVYSMGRLDPDFVVRWTQLAAGGLIVVLGGWLLFQQLTGRGHHHHHHDEGGHHHHHHHHPRDHEHQHDHEHDSAHGGGHARGSRHLSGWGLTLLGITGGILPCPAALAPLLGGMGLAGGELAAPTTHVHVHDIAGSSTHAAAPPHAHPHPHGADAPHVHSHAHDADHPGPTDDFDHAHARTDLQAAAWRGVWAVLAFSLGLATTLTVVGLVVVRARGWAEARFNTAGWMRQLPFVSALLVMALGVFMLTRTLVHPTVHAHVHAW